MTTQTMRPLAILDGVRTPFAKAYGMLARVPADELGRIAVEGVLKHLDLKPDRVDEVIFGNVAGPAESSNVARVIALRSGIPQDRIAQTVNRNCASGMESLVAGWQAIEEGRSQLIVAGGTESMSNIPLMYGHKMTKFFTELSRAKTAWQRAKVMATFRPSFLKPRIGVQLGLTDPVSGLNMGQTAEVLAREFSVSREAQDQFALESHNKAAAARERCFLSGEITPISEDITKTKTVEKDDGPREGQSLEKLAKLKPIFEKEGTVTPGNSCPLTDGAAAVVLTSADHAKSFDVEPLGYIRGYAFAGCDPKRMGLGPVYATSKLLKQSGMTLEDFELFELNEAFAAQVLACQKAMASAEFAKQELGRDKPVGELPMDKLNIHGGAIALGHPVGTTGTRLVITLLRALKEKGLRRGLATLCVGGGQGAAFWLETALD
ncbi:MAG: thiolase family protein [Planctomycetaceae bacterium]|nr:thiolase family protein [Planctomycetaceae bacterium]